MSADQTSRLSPRLRIFAAGEIALGPGKAELLEHIAKTNRLSEAARRMEMSYMKAWLLVQVMNRRFRQPLVLLERGGRKGGNAELSETGKEALALYLSMEATALKAMQPAWKRLRALLRR